jgi:diguanylate cyclase (GGDEF)-like protein
MQSYTPYAYTQEQIGLLETIATQAAIAVQNARLYDQMKQMAITDPVTGLHTRRHFTALGRSEVERALRYGRRLGVLMVDIDHFKRVNDSYGHNAGDVVLHEIAQVCRRALRQTDIVGRWGGEEFAIVLPEADRDGAALIAERIRRMVSEMSIAILDERIRVTVSVGVAGLGEACCSLEMLIDSADRALYAAKQAGRNVVRILES